MLERKRFLVKLRPGGHHDLGEKLLLIMIIELLDDPVSPWLGRWNELQVDAVTQAKANKRTHASRVHRTSKEGPFVVHLKILRDSHAQPGKLQEIGKGQKEMSSLERELYETKRELARVKMERDI